MAHRAVKERGNYCKRSWQIKDHTVNDKGWSSMVNIAIRLWAKWSSFQILVEEKVFLVSKMSRPALGHIQPPILWVLPYFLGVK